MPLNNKKMKRVRAIIFVRNKLILIKRIKKNKVYYVIPGGGVEPGENNQKAIIRECREELGVNIEVRGLLLKKKFKGQQEYFYICSIINGALGTGDGPEYRPNSGYEGEHLVKLVNFQKLREIDLKPAEIKRELMNLGNYVSRITGSGKRFGKFSTPNKDYFFKLLNLGESGRELRGYDALKSYYPLPTFLFSITGKEKTVQIFEFEKSIVDNNGLLADYFARKNKLDSRYLKILKLYKKIFLQTVKNDIGKDADVFFKDRIATRIKKYYNPGFIGSYGKKKFEINGNKVTIDLEKILKEVSLFFNKRKKTWTVISQCDPNDLNVGMKPMIFDYLAGGRVPLMAEFATFIWYNLAQGNYLSLIYNAGSFRGHAAILKKIDSTALKGNQIAHTILPIRKEAIRAYLKEVVKPILKKTGPFRNFYGEFKNYLAMKILAVFDVSKMKRRDQIMCLAYLQYFYDQDIKNIGEFEKMLYKIWKKK